MKSILKYFSVIILLVFNLSIAFAQKDKINITEIQLQALKDDTSKVLALTRLAKIFCIKNQYDSSMRYSNLAFNLALKIDYSYGLALVYSNLGTIYSNKGNSSEALRNFFKSIQIAEEKGIKRAVAINYNNMGAIYYKMGDYPEALKVFIQTMKTEKEIGDTQQIANTYNNTGNIYLALNNYDEAMQYYQLLLKNAELTKNQKLIGVAYNAIGVVQKSQGNYGQALENEELALKIALENNQKELISSVYAAFGDVYLSRKKYDSALVKYRQALKTYKELSDKIHIGMTYYVIGKDYIFEKNYSTAKDYEDSALTISKEVSAKENLKDIYLSLSTIDSAQGKQTEAVKDFKMYTMYLDSISNEENTRKMVSEQLTYEFDMKQVQEHAIQEEKAKSQMRIRNLFIGGFLIAMVIAFIFYFQRRIISGEKKRSDELLLNILPSETAQELKATGVSKPKRFYLTTVMFSDFKNFTQVSEMMSPEELVNDINHCYTAFDRIIAKHGVEKIKTLGDGYMAAGGVPVENKTNPVDTVRAALEMVEFMEGYKKELKKMNKPFYEIRIGINTGPVVAGIVGTKKFAYDIWGDTVNIASRIETAGEAGKVNISDSTYELVKDVFNCTYRGKIEAKNKGLIDMYFVDSEVK